jgi:adenine phosphoribosyltransferase
LGASIFLDLPELHTDLGLTVWSVLDDKTQPEQAVA